MWLQLDLVLVALRDEKDVVDNDKLVELFSSKPKFEMPMVAHAADWAFSFVSRKLFAVLDANLDGQSKNNSTTRTAWLRTAS